MVAQVATLIVTAPNWAQRKSFIASDLSRLCEEAGIGLIDAPVMRIEMTNDAEQRAVLREIAEWDAIKDKAALTVVASGSDAPDALEFFDALCVALKLRVNRLKFAALDLHAAASLSEVCHIKGIDSFHTKSVVIPNVPGSLDDLINKLMRKEEQVERFLVLEPFGSGGMLSKKLIANGLRVIRAGLYTYRPVPMTIRFSTLKAPVWVLVNDVDMVRRVMQELRRNAVSLARVRWIGTHPIVGTLIKQLLPDAVWVQVSEYKASVIVDTIAREA